MSDLDESLHNQIDEAARSYGDESAASIYRRFGLAQRGILLNTFQKYVTTLRKEIAGERINATLRNIGDSEPPTWDEIDRIARISALERLRAGDAKVYELVLLSKSRREHDKLELEKAAESRAEELHRIKLEQVSKTLRKDVDERTEGGTKTLKREEVYDMIDKIMRGE